MNLRNKIIGVALVAALLGGSVGAIVSRTSTEPATASYTARPSADLLDQQNARQVADSNDNLDVLTARNDADVDDASSYRAGFLDGFQAGQQGNAATRGIVTATSVPATRVVYRNAPARRYYRASNSRQVYYDYNQQPRKRSFWQKHRDKLTVAMGAGGGALVGSLIGGKKGAAIGALAGGGGAALYTYVLRKRNRNY